LKLIRRLRPVCSFAANTARSFSASIVIGFSQITSHPARIARIVYSWCR
jgi:hypothetical protein